MKESPIEGRWVAEGNHILERDSEWNCNSLAITHGVQRNARAKAVACLPELLHHLSELFSYWPMFGADDESLAGLDRVDLATFMDLWAERVRPVLDRAGVDLSDSGGVPETVPAGGSESVKPPTQALNIIFDGPPSHESGRFVEVETDDDRSVNCGEWSERSDGLWALRITELPDGSATS